MFHDLHFEDIAEGLAAHRLLIVDVREPHEFAGGRIPGSISLPLSRFNPADLPEANGKRVVFSCAAGVRSLHALFAAQQAGIAIDAHYLGGFKDWLARGGDVERDD